MQFSAGTVRDAIRLLNGEPISVTQAEELADSVGSRDKFLRILLTDLGSLTQYPELLGEIEQAAQAPSIEPQTDARERLGRRSQPTARDVQGPAPLFIRPVQVGAGPTSGVTILALSPMGFGLHTELTRLALPQGWEIEKNLLAGGRSWDGCLRGAGAELSFAGVADTGHIVLLKHPASGNARLRYRGREVTVTLRAPREEVHFVSIAELLNQDDQETGPPQRGVAAVESAELSSTAFYDRILADLDPDEATALHVPRWHGVRSSTLNLFKQTIPIPPNARWHPDDVGPADISFYADLLLASGVRHFVISGGDLFNIEIIKTVLRQNPLIRFDLLWHSNYLQMGEPHDWNLFRHWLREIEDGTVTRIAVVKSGLDEMLRRFGLDAVFVPNIVRVDPSAIKPTTVDNVVGIWLSESSSYRKLPHAMIAGVKAMRGVYLKGSGLGQEGLSLISALDVPFLRLFETAIPRERLYKEISTTALSLYVTISECSPMLPLESFALGVPCLIGACSHLFRDHQLLRRALVVDQPCNPSMIADMAVGAIRDKDKIVDAYRAYAFEQQEAADAAMAKFLG